MGAGGEDPHNGGQEFGEELKGRPEHESGRTADGIPGRMGGPDIKTRVGCVDTPFPRICVYVCVRARVRACVRACVRAWHTCTEKKDRLYRARQSPGGTIRRYGHEKQSKIGTCDRGEGAGAGDEREREK